MSLRRDLVLLGIAAALVILPLLLFGSLGEGAGGGFTGTDDQAASLVTRIAPGYRPWSGALFALDEGAVRVLFGLQAALGGGFIAYYIARSARRKRTETAPE